MRRFRRRKRHELRNRIILLLCGAALLFGVAVLGFQAEKKQRVQERGVSSQDVGLLRRMTYDGQTYVEKADVTTILLMGVDRESGELRYGARQGGQADFLVLLAIDHEGRQIHQLHIDRDTMIDVDALSVLGKPIGLRTMQICLAHAFGTTGEASAENTVAAVERLLEGLEVDFYLSLDLDAIGVINEALGGIAMTLEEDFSYIDPAMTRGATLQLTNEQAHNLVQRRLDVGDGTNEARMARQQAFLRAVSAQLQQTLRQNPAFISSLFELLQPHMTTNMQQSQMAAEANLAYHYDALPAEQLAGEHTIGEDGFVEFHVRDAEAPRWVAKTLYKPDSY